MARPAWFILTWLLVACGAAGAVLPLVPTTPFLLAAAWTAPKASPALARWLDTHPWFGPFLADWRAHRSLSLRVKGTAVIMLILAWSLLWRRGADPLVLTITGVLFAVIGSWLATRPTARRKDP